MLGLRVDWSHTIRYREAGLCRPRSQAVDFGVRIGEQNKGERGRAEAIIVQEYIVAVCICRCAQFLDSEGPKPRRQIESHK